MTDTPASAWKVTGLLQVLFERVCLAPVSSRGAKVATPGRRNCGCRRRSGGSSLKSTPTR
jgi:hypothetical protein